jgi:YVTN family beta-propeller protein
MDITPDGARIYTASRAYPAVKVIDTLTNSVIATIPVSLTPSHILTEVEITPDGRRAYVTITNDSRISIVDTDPNSPTYNQEIDVIDAGLDANGNPRALTELDITEDGKLGFVANGLWYTSGNELLVIDTDPVSPYFHTILASIEVGDIPYGVVVQPLPVAEAYVANGDGTVSVIGHLPIIPVDIDIKPGSETNSINLGSNGNVPVAIFSTTDFDATNVDPLTIKLAGADVRIRGKGDSMRFYEDVDGDGLLDILVHVDTRALELSSTNTVAVLTGQTFDGIKIRGEDTVTIVKDIN